jgi:hypothetical protein
MWPGMDEATGPFFHVPGIAEPVNVREQYYMETN